MIILLLSGKVVYGLKSARNDPSCYTEHSLCAGHFYPLCENPTGTQQLGAEGSHWTVFQERGLRPEAVPASRCSHSQSVVGEA